jgi:hypothetical protein
LLLTVRNGSNALAVGERPPEILSAARGQRHSDLLWFSLASAMWLGFLLLRWQPGLSVRGAGGLVCLCFRWHPRYAFVLQALPLCGAAPTFLCRRKEK